VYHLSDTRLTVPTVLGFLPGLFHAWYIIAVSPDPTYEQVNDEEQGNVTYYYVQGQPQYAPGGGQRTRQQGYGTVNNTPNAQFPGQQNGFVGGGPSAPTPAESSRPSTDVPPSYAQAVQGDHKVQSS
jgi:hypothetical protein